MFNYRARIPTFRPLVKELVKSGIAIGKWAHVQYEETKEFWTDVAAEARSEIDDAKQAQFVKGSDQSDLQTTLEHIRGIGSEYGRLLEAAGIRTVDELASLTAERLRELLENTNEKHEIVKQPPSVKVLESWIERAKTKDFDQTNG